MAILLPPALSSEHPCLANTRRPDDTFFAQGFFSRRKTISTTKVVKKFLCSQAWIQDLFCLCFSMVSLTAGGMGSCVLPFSPAHDAKCAFSGLQLPGLWLVYECTWHTREKIPCTVFSEYPCLADTKRPDDTFSPM